MNALVKILILITSLSLLALWFGNNSVSSDKRGTESNSSELQQKTVVKKKEIELPTIEYKMPPASNLSDFTQKIVGYDTGLTLAERNKLVWKLSKEGLDHRDFEALFTFLKLHPPEKISQLSWHSLKNDLLVMLIDDGRYKESTADVMIDIINDPEQHSVMREYVLQYTTDYFEKHWFNKLKAKEKSNYTDVDLDIQNRMYQAMLASLKSEEGPIAGTSLIRLHQLSKNFEFIDEKLIQKETERMVKDSIVPEASRMAALSIAAERKVLGLKTDIESILFDNQQSVILRMSALNTLLKLDPSESQIEKVQKEFVENPSVDLRLKKAAKLTIENLNRIKG